MEIISVFQGDITDIILVRPMVLASGDPIGANFTCKISVIDPTGLVAVAARVVIEKATKSIKNIDGSYSDEECFLCYLIPTETTDLIEDDNTFHTLVVEVKNEAITPVFNKEEPYLLQVKKQGIPAA